MTNYREILRLDSLGLNKTRLPKHAGVQEQPSSKHFRLAKENRLEYPLPDGLSGQT